MTKLMPGVRREDLVPADDPGEGLRIAEEAARQLKVVYGERLRQVVLFGSWVRGQAHEESNVHLIVVLDQIDNRARERDRLVDVLYDLEVESRRAIQAFPVAEADALSGERRAASERSSRLLTAAYRCLGVGPSPDDAVGVRG